MNAMSASGAPVKTTCPYCGVGCGVEARVAPDGAVSIKGDKEHPANFGRLCSKGSALGETLSLDDRLLHPMIGGARATWDAALDRVASEFSRAVVEHGPDSVAIYAAGQLLTEDYYVANKLMKGFIGSGNMDTNSRLCMASTVAGHRRAFGADVVPGTYEDLEQADVIVLVGSNLAWCHPVLFQRIEAARRARPITLVAIDPRATTTSDSADLHLPLAPDTDVALFLGLLRWLDKAGRADQNWLAAHVGDAREARAAAEAFDLDATARATDLSRESIAHFFDLFARHERVVTVFSQGVNQSQSGVDKVSAIINCHLLTGRIGKPGMGPFSVTGQPNAMGGREVGGLANMLAAHMDIEDARARDRVARFWNAPHLARKSGLKAVDLFEAAHQGRIKALWIISTNPVVSMPDADRVREAIALCPFVVVQDACANTDTARLAHVLLPAAAWGEKDGTVTNSERRISRQRAFIAAPGEARPDWQIICDVARRMGFSGFDFAGPAAIFREHAALSAFENDGARAFDIGAHSGIDELAYARLAPFQWPLGKNGAARERFFAQGGFYTPDGRARMAATPYAAARADGRFTLNTGRVRDQWHTMTRSGKSARLMAQYAEPFCEIHPDDAARLGIAPASLVELSNAGGRVVLRALVTPRQRAGSLFAPMHWTDAFAANARVDVLVAPACDALSGQPASKQARCEARPYAAVWHGFAIAASKPDPQHADYWALAPADGGWRIELAGQSLPADWRTYAAKLFGAPASGALEWLAFEDRAKNEVRLAAFDGARLVGALFVARGPVAVARPALVGDLRRPRADGERLSILAGRPGADRPDPGALVCACFNIGVNQIRDAIRSGRAQSVDAVGDMLKAGTNCGSCRVEIGRMIADDQALPRESRASREMETPLRVRS
jgi:assimilatory nitrate reductase catalytic subunit